jgi:uncharacterized protein YdaU (DUF1376 family)
VNGLPYYKAYPRDFFEGTVGMDGDLKGAYRMVLDLIYMHAGNLPDNAGYICGHLGLSVRQWSFHRKRLIATGKLFVRDEFIASSRADQELFATRSYQEQQAFNGSQPKKNKHIPEAVVKPTLNHTEPDTDTEDREAKASLVRSKDFQTFWERYPHRDGIKRNRGTAEKKYRLAVKSGVSEQAILDGVERVKADPRVSTGYARDPTTWLNQRGWEDTAPAPASDTSKLDFLAARIRLGQPLYADVMTVELTEGLISRGDLTREAAATMGLPLAADPIRRTA